jgi:threonylcarbamoyladenosine tRNA methylthiotransferase MtaB
MSQAPLSFFPQTPPVVTKQSSTRLTATEQARRPTFALYTLGCKVNQYDSHQISRALTQRGFRRVEFRESADLYVIDTCTVTAEADRKSRKAAGRAHRNNREAIVAVTGCAATYARDQFLQVAPNALILDNTRKWELPELAIEALRARPDWDIEYSKLRQEIGSEPQPAATRERAVLKIQDGCNHKCSYCIIPKVRGASITKARETVMQEARAFVREGARELTVTGVSMSDWNGGKDEIGNLKDEERVLEARSSSFKFPISSLRGRNAALCDLLRAVSKIEGLERVRVSSLDPADVDEEFLQTIAHTPTVCPHLHLALQSGSGATLRRMRRRYTPEMFGRAARRWREIRPDGGLTTDIIVGFPGETDQEFEQTLQLAREAQFSAIHVFPYSPRAGTVAANLPDHVAPDVQKRRVEQLLHLAREASANYAAQFLGQEVPVLIEGTSSDQEVEGLTPHYVKARVRLSSQSSTRFAPGDIVWLRAAHWNGQELEGEQVFPDNPALNVGGHTTRH